MARGAWWWWGYLAVHRDGDGDGEDDGAGEGCDGHADGAIHVLRTQATGGGYRTEVVREASRAARR